MVAGDCALTDDGVVMIGVIAFLGAVLGSMLGYLGTTRATQVERQARHREEWGRRFTHALEMSLSAHAHAQRPGMALLELLGSSELATEEERGYVRAVLAAASTGDQDARLRNILDESDGDEEV
jgi:hypothetical protein